MTGDTLKGVLKLVRIPFLILGLLLFLCGALLAMDLGFRVTAPAIILGYSILLTAQLSVHLGNDYFDLETDLHGEPTPFSGGSGVLTVMPELRRPARLAAMAFVGISVLLGAAYALLFIQDAASRTPFMVYILGGNALSWTYTAPPIKLVYRGIGEIAVGLGVGTLWSGLGYLVTAGKIDLPFLFLALPFYFIVLACIIATEIPDMAADRRANKMTLVARWGERTGYTGAAMAAAAAPAVAMLPVAFPGLVPGVNFIPIAIIALFPVFASVLGIMRRPGDRPQLVTYMKGVMMSLFVAVILADAYFAGRLYNPLP
jgi:1,4-dihydroxy-2-naphthoate octaprenyltransferase